MKLSQRMKQILDLLNGRFHEYTEEETSELKKKLENLKLMAANLSAKLGRLTHDDLDSLKERLTVTDEQLENEIQERNSISLGDIILACENLWDRYQKFLDGHGLIKQYEKELYADPHRNPSYFSMSRWHVSLVEIIAGKLFPKGRSWRSHVHSRHFDGYEEAYKKAKSLQASYSRTMNNLQQKGLVQKFHRQHHSKRIFYVITEKGRETLAILTQNRIDNTR